MNMRPLSPIALAGLALALLWALVFVNGAQANRLVHRQGGVSPKGGLRELLEDTADAIKDGVEEIAHRVRPQQHRNGKHRRPHQMDRFAVLHSDSTGVDALNVLLDAQTASNDVWLYGDIPRWNDQHVEHLWTFACGRTQGRWYVGHLWWLHC